MTEDQARTKWCPFARVTSYIDAGASVAMSAINKTADAKIADGATCIVSRCMAWRSVAAGRGWCGLASQNEPWEPPGSL